MIIFYLIGLTRIATLSILSILLFKQIKNIWVRRHNLNGVQPYRMMIILLTLSMWIERAYRVFGNITTIFKLDPYMDYLESTQPILFLIQIFSLYATYIFYKLVKDNHDE